MQGSRTIVKEMLKGNTAMGANTGLGYDHHRTAYLHIKLSAHCLDTGKQSIARKFEARN